MRSEDREHILWQLTEADSPSVGGDAVADEVLDAFRRGELDAQESAEVVRKLTRHPASRRRLLELGKVRLPAAPGRVLRRLLSSHGRMAVRRLRPLRVAALLAATLGAVFIGWWLIQPTALRTDSLPAHTVGIAALAIQRDGPATGQSATAYAETPVSITATVERQARAGVALALFRHSGDRLERIDAGRGVMRTERRGAVRFEAPAHTLVGYQPGEHTIFVVVAWQGDLPRTLSLPRGADPMTELAAGGRRRVYPLPLRLLPSATGPPADSGENGPT